MRQSPRGRWETVASSGAPNNGANTVIRLFREFIAPKVCPWLWGSAAPEMMLCREAVIV